VAHGESVIEVPPFLTHRERKRCPSKGKTDHVDAVAIARVVARGEGLFSHRRSEVLDDLKVLSDHRGQLVRARTQLANRAHGELAILCPGYQTRVPKLTNKKHLTAALTLIRRDQSARAELIRDHIFELRRLDARIAKVTRRLAAKVVESGTALTGLRASRS
jgi:transposase